MIPAVGTVRNGPVTRIKRALERVSAHIERQTDRNSVYSRGLAREGYDGGYAQALSDVLLTLRGVMPNRHPQWWEDTPPISRKQQENE